MLATHLVFFISVAMVMTTRADFQFDPTCVALACEDDTHFTPECRKQGLYISPDGKFCRGCDVCTNDTLCASLQCGSVQYYDRECTVRQYYTSGFFFCPGCLTNIC